MTLCAVLGGCAASKQEVVTRLGEQYIGQNVDALVVQFGPPTSMFKMNSGQTSYIWQLSAVTDIATDRGSGTASKRYCKVSVIASPIGVVQQLKPRIRTPAVVWEGFSGCMGACAPSGSELDRQT
jgi:hypothetical protein